MKKQSLLISDEERYGPKSPAVLAGDGKDKDRKTAPTIDLVGKQVDAFCTCDLKPGETGVATVHYTVKSVKMGDEYGNDVPSKNSTKRVTLSLTHVEAEGEDDEESPDEESPEHEAKEAPAEEKAEQAAGDDDEEPAAPETDAPATKRKSVSPKDAALED